MSRSVYEANLDHCKPVNSNKPQGGKCDLVPEFPRNEHQPIILTIFPENYKKLKRNTRGGTHIPSALLESANCDIMQILIDTASKADTDLIC